MAKCETEEGDFKVDLVLGRKRRSGSRKRMRKEDGMIREKMTEGFEGVDGEKRKRKSEEVSQGICRFHNEEFKRPF